MIRLWAAFNQESGDQDADKGCTFINSVGLGEVTLLPFVFPNELMLANTPTLSTLKKILTWGYVLLILATEGGGGE